MINFSVLFCGRAGGIVKAQLLPTQTRFCAFAALQQDQGYIAAGVMTDGAQPFGLQFRAACAGAKLSQTLRFVDQKEITAEAKRPGSCPE